MSEQRFIVADHSTCVFDKITKEEYVCIDREEAFLVCKRLNEQQSTIQSLKEENKELRKELDNFKPVIFQDMRKGTVILYSKGDSNE